MLFLASADLMELLVANKIIDPSISIELVYKKIWIPYI